MVGATVLPEFTDLLFVVARNSAAPTLIFKLRCVCRTWRDVYRDRHEGLGLALRVLAWLRQSHHPSDVSGRQHRDQLRLALAYLCMATVPTHGGQPRTRQVALRLPMPWMPPGLA